MDRTTHRSTSFPEPSFEGRIDGLLDEAQRSINHRASTWTPACNVFEHSDAFFVQIALPGMNPDQLDVQVENRTLWVKGERREDRPEGTCWYAHDVKEGPFACSFQLPAGVDAEKPRAWFKQGLLTLKFSKTGEAKPRRILIDCV